MKSNKQQDCERLLELTSQSKELRKTIEELQDSISAEAGEVRRCAAGNMYIVGKRNSMMVEKAPDYEDRNDNLFGGRSASAEEFVSTGDVYLGQFRDIFFTSKQLGDRYVPRAVLEGILDLPAAELRKEIRNILKHHAKK